MALRPGFKRTEIGIIPEDWDAKRVSELAQIKTGPFGTLLKASEYSDSQGVPLISVGEIGAGHFKVTEHTPLAPAAVVRRLPQYVLQIGDIVFGRKGAVERSALITINESGWFLGSDGIAIRPLSGCHPPYLAVQFQGQKVKSWLLQNAIGTTMASLNQGILGRVQIAIAPLREQVAIATALSDVDVLLRGLDRLIAKKRDLKQAAMQQLLSAQTRLPGFSGAWEVKTLRQVATIRDGTHQTPKYVGSGIPFYSVEQVTSGDFTNTKFISETEHRFLTKSFKIERGDILMTRIGSIGDCKLIDWDVEASFYVSLALLKIHKGYSAAFISHYSKSAHFQKEIELHSLQSAIPKKINLGPISNVRIEFPPLPEQTAIAAVLSDMDTELSALQSRRDKTRDLKQAMMQELLTGKTRLIPTGATHA